MEVRAPSWLLVSFGCCIPALLIVLFFLYYFSSVGGGRCSVVTPTGSSCMFCRCAATDRNSGDKAATLLCETKGEPGRNWRMETGEEEEQILECVRRGVERCPMVAVCNKQKRNHPFIYLQIWMNAVVHSSA